MSGLPKVLQDSKADSRSAEQAQWKVGAGRLASVIIIASFWDVLRPGPSVCWMEGVVSFGGAKGTLEDLQDD